MLYLISTSVALAVVIVLVGILLLVESKVVLKGDRTITINDDESKTVTATGSGTLLSALLENDILLPCACGGKGSCGTCKCVVTSGGGSILPTELSLVSRAERLQNVRLACQVKVKEDMRIQIPDEIFSIEKYTGKVVSNQNVATFIKELVVGLDPGQRIEFKAGAYMQIDIPEYSARYADFQVEEEYLGAWKHFGLLGLEAINKEPDLRAYSLANPPAEQGILKFTIRIASPPPNMPDARPGIGSSYVYSLKPGDVITLSGPYGDFFAKETDREMCFIGGGAGMAPMRSHILHQLLTVTTDRRVTFWYGARSKSEMFYDEEFTGLTEKFSNFSYHVALSDPQPEDHWDGMTGFIHQVVHDHYLAGHEDPTEIEYYLCGPPLMMSAVTTMLESLGVEPEMIDFDDFGG